MMMMMAEVTQMHLLYPDASPPYNLQLIPGFWCTNPIPLKMFIHFLAFFPNIFFTEKCLDKHF